MKLSSIARLPQKSASEQAPVSDLRLRDIVHRELRFVWRVIRRLGVTESQADDLTQQVFMVLMEKLHDVVPGSERSFLYGVAIRHVRRQRETFHKEAHRYQVLDPGCELSSQDARGEELLQEKRRRQMLDHALAAMSLELRTVFVLHELEGITMAEIAELENIPPGTAASRLRRAREQFRQKAALIRGASPLGGKS